MAPDQIEQEIDSLRRRVEALEAKERARTAEHDRLEEAFQGAITAPTNYGVPGNSCSVCGEWNALLEFGGTCGPCLVRSGQKWQWPKGHPYDGLAGNDY